jgi:hypothetical protein
MAADDGAERAKQERQAERRKRHDLRQQRIVLVHRRKKQCAKRQARRLRVDEEVVPLDRGADQRRGEDLAFLIRQFSAAQARGQFDGHVASPVSVLVLAGRFVCRDAMPAWFCLPG